MRARPRPVLGPIHRGISPPAPPPPESGWIGDVTNVFLPEDYGAVGDGTTNDAAAVQQAVDAADAADGTCWLGNVYGIGANTTIEAKTKCQILGGSRYGTGFRALGTWTSGTPIVALDSIEIQKTALMNFSIDGVGALATCIKFDNTDATKSGWEGPDAINSISTMYLANGFDGIFTEGNNGRGVRVSDVRIWNPANNGLRVSANDGFFHNIDIGSAGSDGVNIDGGSNFFSLIKSWFSDGDGWFINATRNTFVGCQAQDNLENGFNLVSGKNVYTGCIADSNNNTGSAKNASFAGFRIASSFNTMSACQAFDKIEGGVTKQDVGVDWISGGGLTDSDISLVCYDNDTAAERGTQPTGANGNRVFIASN